MPVQRSRGSLNPGKAFVETTWAARPLSAQAGDRAWFTDAGVNGSEWVWDGTYWVPAAPVVLFRAAGTVAAPLATLTAVTSGTFATPGSVPAGMFIKPGMQLIAEARFKRSTATATAILQASVGGAGAANNQIAAAANQSTKLSGGMVCVTSATQTIDQFQSLNTSTLNAIIDASVNFNNAQAFALTLSSANVADSFSLLSYSLTLYP